MSAIAHEWKSPAARKLAAGTTGMTMQRQVYEHLLEGFSVLIAEGKMTAADEVADFLMTDLSDEWHDRPDFAAAYTKGWLAPPGDDGDLAGV